MADEAKIPASRRLKRCIIPAIHCSTLPLPRAEPIVQNKANSRAGRVPVTASGETPHGATASGACRAKPSQLPRDAIAAKSFLQKGLWAICRQTTGAKQSQFRPAGAGAGRLRCGMPSRGAGRTPAFFLYSSGVSGYTRAFHVHLFIHGSELTTNEK